MLISNPTQKTKKEIWLAHKKEVWGLRQRGWTQERIGAHMSISQAAVSKLLSVAAAEYRKRYINSVDKVQAEHIMRLEHIVNEAMNAWEKSCESFKSQSSKNEIPFTEELKEFASKIFKKSPSKTITQYIEERCGDPRFLQVAMKAQEDIRKIVGADAPTRVINENSPKNAYYEKMFAEGISMEDAQKAYQELLQAGTPCSVNSIIN